MQVCAHGIIKGPHHILDILTWGDAPGPMPFLYDNPIQPHSVLGTIPSQNIPWLSPVLNIPRPFVCGSRMVEISAEIAPCIRTLGLGGGMRRVYSHATRSSLQAESLVGDSFTIMLHTREVSQWHSIITPHSLRSHTRSTDPHVCVSFLSLRIVLNAAFTMWHRGA
jgi:hypothetical protein